VINVFLINLIRTTLCAILSSSVETFGTAPSIHYH